MMIPSTSLTFVIEHFSKRFESENIFIEVRLLHSKPMSYLLSSLSGYLQDSRPECPASTINLPESRLGPFPRHSKINRYHEQHLEVRKARQIESIRDCQFWIAMGDHTMANSPLSYQQRRSEVHNAW